MDDIAALSVKCLVQVCIAQVCVCVAVRGRRLTVSFHHCYTTQGETINSVMFQWWANPNRDLI